MRLPPPFGVRSVIHANHFRRAAGTLGALLALALLFGTAANAQEPTPAVERQNAIIVATLIRTTLVALHQANITGNYTVLRDLAAPGFRERNSAADLAAIFNPIRQQKIDLGAVVVLDPQLTAAPRIDEQKMLRIAGTFQTAPAPVAFELAFQPVDNQWRVFGVSIRPIRPVAAAPGANAPAQAAKPKAPTEKSAARPAKAKAAAPAQAKSAQDAAATSNAASRDPWLFSAQPALPAMPLQPAQPSR